MKTEKELRYMLERLTSLNDFISKAEEAKQKRNQLRKEITGLMSIYVETLNEMP